MPKTALLTAGTIFALVALIHLYRLFSHFRIVVGTTEIPIWVNFIGILIAGTLSYWMFTAAKLNK